MAYLQHPDKHEIEGSGGGGAEVYHREGSGTPNYVDDPENEGLFRESSVESAARSHIDCIQGHSVFR